MSGNVPQLRLCWTCAWLAKRAFLCVCFGWNSPVVVPRCSIFHTVAHTSLTDMVGSLTMKSNCVDLRASNTVVWNWDHPTQAARALRCHPCNAPHVRMDCIHGDHRSSYTLILHIWSLYDTSNHDIPKSPIYSILSHVRSPNVRAAPCHRASSLFVLQCSFDATSLWIRL